MNVFDNARECRLDPQSCACIEDNKEPHIARAIILTRFGGVAKNLATSVLNLKADEIRAREITSFHYFPHLRQNRKIRTVVVLPYDETVRPYDKIVPPDRQKESNVYVFSCLPIPIHNYLTVPFPPNARTVTVEKRREMLASIRCRL